MFIMLHEIISLKQAREVYINVDDIQRFAWHDGKTTEDGLVLPGSTILTFRSGLTRNFEIAERPEEILQKIKEAKEAK